MPIYKVVKPIDSNHLIANLQNLREANMAVMNPYNYSKPRNFIKIESATEKEEKRDELKSKSQYVNDKMDQYLESKINSAKPEELTYMLYEGIVKFIKKAMLGLEAKNFESVNYNVQRAQLIVDELRATLNMDIPMSVSLDSLYEYLNYKLVNANITKKESEFQEALEIAEDFKDTWKQAFNIK